MGEYSALWLLMPWYKSTRPSVSTVLSLYVYILGRFIQGLHHINNYSYGEQYQETKLHFEKKYLVGTGLTTFFPLKIQIYILFFINFQSHINTYWCWCYWKRCQTSFGSAYAFMRYKKEWTMRLSVKFWRQPEASPQRLSQGRIAVTQLSGQTKQSSFIIAHKKSLVTIWLNKRLQPPKIPNFFA